MVGELRVGIATCAAAGAEVAEVAFNVPVGEAVDDAGPRVHEALGEGRRHGHAAWHERQGVEACHGVHRHEADAAVGIQAILATARHKRDKGLVLRATAVWGRGRGK